MIADIEFKGSKKQGRLNALFCLSAARGDAEAIKNYLKNIRGECVFIGGLPETIYELNLKQI